MTNVQGDGDGGSAEELRKLMALLARVNDEMIVIANELRTKPAVSEARRGCDLREYRDAFRFDDKAFYAFEAYVEADTRDGYVVSWLVDVNWTPSGWEFQRAICRNRDDLTTTFPVVRSDSFSEFASKVADPLNEFVESARSHQFI
jgi:hypothetical protein